MSQANWADRLSLAVERVGNPCLVGLDPHLALMPAAFAAAHDAQASRSEVASAVGDFLCQVVEVIAGRVAVVKPQAAFFETLGPAGAQQWERVVSTAHDAGLLVIGDLKRGDIGSTAAAYAEAFLTGGPGSPAGSTCDAMTVNPYLGGDSLAPFIKACAATGRGLYVLVRTSNPGCVDFQDHGSPPLCELVAASVEKWGAPLVGEGGLSSVGAVVGATHPAELARLRELMPHTPFLLPGYGAQGGGAADVVPGFLGGLRGAVVNSSRGILYPSSKGAGNAVDAGSARGADSADWKTATSRALDAMIADIGAALILRA
ncbi:MAG: orotidine-5'-phosphate decarboxylase [Planctomycetes bacterium]|nr:orotidine-5'-phosphate decarboxylase [Planctomycetota bacterium]